MGHPAVEEIWWWVVGSSVVLRTMPTHAVRLHEWGTRHPGFLHSHVSEARHGAPRQGAGSRE